MTVSLILPKALGNEGFVLMRAESFPLRLRLNEQRNLVLDWRNDEQSESEVVVSQMQMQNKVKYDIIILKNNESISLWVNGVLD